MNTAKKTRNSGLRHWRRDILFGGGEPTPPIAPSGFTAEADGGYASMSLSWVDNSADEDGFRIYRSTNGGVSYSELTTVAANTTYYQDTGLTRGDTYHYYVVAYIGAVKSTASNVDSDTIFDADALIASDGYALWDMDQDVFVDAGITPAVDGNAVQQVNDQTGNGRHLTQTSAAAKMTYKTNIINGHNVVRGLGGDYMQNSVLADWKLLHDGSPFTIFMVWKTTTSEPNAVQGLLCTSAGSTSNIGYFSSSDDRDSVPRYHTVVNSIVRGTAGVSEVGATTLHNSVRCGRWHVTVTSRQGVNGTLVLENDGHWGGDASGVAAGAPSASNPTSPLTIAATGTGASTLSGDIAYVAIFNELTDTERKQFSQYLGERFAQPEYLYFQPGSLLVDATSEPTYDYAWGAGIAIAPNGDIVVIYAQGTAHTVAVRYLKAIISSDKGATWGSPITIWDRDVDGGGTISHAGFGLMLYGNTLYLKTSRGVGTSDGPWLFYSSDNGQTWSDPVDMDGNVGSGDHRGDGGPIIVLQNGDWLAPYFYQVSGDTWTVAVVRSQNEGVTWAHLSEAATGVKYVEPGIVQLDSGAIIMHIRDDEPQRRTIRYVISNDNGQTWGSVLLATNGYGPQAPYKTQDNDVIMHVRHPGFYYSRAYATVFHQQSSDLTKPQLGHIFELSPNDLGAGQPVYGHFWQDVDGTIYCSWGTETNDDASADIMFTKAVRGI